jgi:O-antigen/teichoic acid export membrane protein
MKLCLSRTMKIATKQNTKKKPDHSSHLEIGKFIQDIGFVGFAEIFVSFGGIILIPLLTKTLGAYGYGLWQQAMVTIGILSPLASFGLNNALVRFLPAKKQKNDKQQLFLSILFFKFTISILLLSLFIVFSERIAHYFFNNETSIVLITGFIFLIGGTNILCQFYFRSLRKIKIYSLFRIIDSYAKIAVAYYMILIGKGIFGALQGYLCVEIIFLFIYLGIIISEIGFSVPKFSDLKQYLKYGIPLIPTGISLWMIMFSDRYVISYYMEFSNVGVYSAAYNVGFLFFMIVELFDFVLMPTIAKFYDEGNVEKVKTYLRFVFKIYLLLAIPAIVGLSFLSKQILVFFTTAQIAENGWLITPIIAISSLFSGLFVIYDKPLRMSKKTSKIGLIVTITAILNLLLNFGLIPRYGILGAAIATLISYCFSASIIIIFSVKEMKFGINPHILLKTLCASFVIGVICYVWQPSSFIGLIFCIITSFITYFIILYLIGGIKIDEIKSLFSMMKQK